jgi:tape measure domain-containing protein
MSQNQVVDNTIIKATFDNAQFERDVKTTMTTLDKLLDKIDMKGVLAAVGKQADAVGRTFSVGNLAQGLMAVSQGFSNFGVIGVTTLSNLTNSAVNAGKQIVSALTIDPVRSGFQEYELKMQSVQTIMAGTGESIEVVTQALNELNKYSDETIYSFADMTQNIGKFTNAGVSLDRSVAAIKGISNVAAVAGANANEASRAMYNFAQAISSGSVKLIDWKSIELANMGTMEFKQQLIDTASAMGTLKKSGDGMYSTIDGKLMNATQGFNDSLQDQWMTTEVLLNTLNRYSDATTDIGKKAAVAATEVKTITQMFDVMKEFVQSGWAQTFEAIVGNKVEAVKTLTAISNAFSSILQPSIDARNEALAYWKTFKGRFYILEGFANIFKYFSRVIEPIKNAMREMFPPITGQTLVKISKAFFDFTKKLEKGNTTADNTVLLFRKVAGALLSVWKLAGVAFKAFIEFSKMLVPIASLFLTGLASVVEFGAGLLTAITNVDNISKVLYGLRDGVIFVAQVFLAAAYSVGTFTESVKNSEPVNQFGKAINKVQNFISSIGPAFQTAMAYIQPFIDKIAGFVSTLTQEDYTKIAAGGGIMALIYLLFKGIKGVLGIFKPFQKISEVLGTLKDTMETYQRTLKANVLIKIATAIAILAASLFVLAMIDSDKLLGSIGAMVSLMGGLTLVMFALKKMFGESELKNAVGTTSAMVLIAFAVTILSGALSRIADIDSNKLWQSVYALAAVMAMMTLMISLLATYAQDTKGMIKAGLGMNAFGTALLVLVRVLSELDALQMDIWSMIGNIIALGVLMGYLAVIMKVSEKAKMGLGTGLGFLAIAASVMMLVPAIKALGEMGGKEIKQGMFALFGIMLFVGAYLGLVGMVGLGALAAAASFAIIAGSLYIMIGAMQLLGMMDATTYVQSIDLLSKTFAVLGKGMLQLILGLPGAVALAIISAALLMFLPVIAALSLIPQDKLDTALKAIAVFLKIVAKAGFALGLAAPGLIAGGIGLALLGVGMLAAGKGMLYFATGLVALVGVGAAGLVTLAGLITTVAIGIPTIAMALAVGIITFIKIIAENIPKLMLMFRNIFIGWLAIINEIAPMLINLIGNLVVLLSDRVIKDSSKLTKAGYVLVMAFINEIVANQKEVSKKGIMMIAAILQGIGEGMPALIDSSYNMVIDFVRGLTVAVREKGTALRRAGRELTTEVVKQIILTVAELQDDVNKAFLALLIGALSLPKQQLDSTIKLLFKDASDQVYEGIKMGLAPTKFKLLGNLIGDNLVKGTEDSLGIESPSKVYAAMMSDIADGIGVGIADQAKDIQYHASMIGRLMVVGTASGFTAAVKKDTSLLDMKRMLLEDTFQIETKRRDPISTWLDAMKTRAKDGIADIIGDLGSGLDEMPSYKGGGSAPASSEYSSTIEDEEEKSFNHSREWIDERKYYNELSLTEELAAWMRVQKRYAIGNKHRKAADKEVYRLRQELIRETADINKDYADRESDIILQLENDIKSLEQSYDESIRSRSEALYDSYALFDEVDRKAIVSGSKLTDNLRAQVSEFKDWQNQIADLKSKGLNEDLLSELTAMGPKSIAEVKALNKLTEGQLWIYVELWKDKHAAAKAQAELEMEGLAESVVGQINQLTIDAEVALDANKKAWDAALKGLTLSVSDNFQEATEKIVQQLDAIEEPVTKEVEAITSAIQSAFTKPKWSDLGKAIIEGLILGMKSMETQLFTATSTMATGALLAAKKALESNSPSKKFQQLGEDVDQGFINGILRKSSAVVQTGTTMGEDVYNSFRSVLSKMDGYLTGELNLNPVVRPVLDLSDLQNGSGLISDMFDAPKYSFNIGNSMLNSSKRALEGTDRNIVNQAPVEIHVNNVVRNDSDITKINRGMDRLVTKYSSAKGVRG